MLEVHLQYCEERSQLTYISMIQSQKTGRILKLPTNSKMISKQILEEVDNAVITVLTEKGLLQNV